MNHAQEAKRLISATTTKDWNDPSPYVDRRIAAAQVHATLALAEQQRIANLIAAYDMGAADAPSGIARISYAKILDQIMEALELGDPA